MWQWTRHERAATFSAPAGTAADVNLCLLPEVPFSPPSFSSFLLLLSLYSKSLSPKNDKVNGFKVVRFRLIFEKNGKMNWKMSIKIVFKRLEELSKKSWICSNPHHVGVSQTLSCPSTIEICVHPRLDICLVVYGMARKGCGECH